jgi:hypothetical protein
MIVITCKCHRVRTMASFTCYDAVCACLPSLRLPNLSPSDPPRLITGHRELERRRRRRRRRLLLDAHASNTDPEILSLHSDVFDPFRLDKRRSNPKRISLFGFDLFGRPPIQLPSDDHQDQASAVGRARYKRANDGRIGESSSSSSTHALDSDAAAPLDSSAIESLVTPSSPTQSPFQTPPAHSHDLRVQQKRKWREQKLVAAFLLHEDGDAFEGFQGSGTARPPPTRRDQADNFTLSNTSSSVTHTAMYALEDAEDADLGGGLYTRAPTVPESGGTSSSSRSHPRLHSDTTTTASSVPRRHTDASSTPKDVPPRQKKSSKKRGATSESSSSQLQSESPATPNAEEPQRIPFDGYPPEDNLMPGEELSRFRVNPGVSGKEAKDVLASLGA